MNKKIFFTRRQPNNTQMASYSPSALSSAFTETEARVLVLYDQLQQLQLELALLQSQQNIHRVPGQKSRY